MTGHRARDARGGVFMTTDVAARGLMFVLLVIAARQLHTTAYGEFTFVFAIVAVALLLSDLGLTPLLMRRLAEGADDLRVAFWSASAVNVGLGVLAYAVVVVALAALRPSLTPVVAIYGCVLAVQGLATSVDALMFTEERSALVGVFRLVGNGTALGIGAWALTRWPSPALLGGILLLGSIGKLALGTITMRSSIGAPTFQLDCARSMLRQAVPFALAAVFSFLYFRVDVVLLGALKEAQSVGLYGAAYRILDGIMLLPAAVSLTSFPTWVRERNGERIVRVLAAASCAGASLCGLLGVFAPSLVRLVYGSQYAPSSDALVILALGLPLLFVDALAVWLAYALHRERSVIGVGAFALSINVGTNLALIPRFDFRGAAVATVASEVANFAGYVWVFRREIRMHLGAVRRLGVPAGAALAAAGLSVFMARVVGLQELAVAVSAIPALAVGAVVRRRPPGRRLASRAQPCGSAGSG